MKFIIKKTGMLLFTLLVISFLSFLAFQIIPGDAALSQLGTQSSPERVEALRQELGLNDPVPVRYGRWLAGFVRGDMGQSYSYHMPVSQMLSGKLPIMIVLTLLSFFLMLCISVPIGLLCARHEGGVLDRVLIVMNQVVMSIPGFFLGIIITWLFGLALHWFVPGGYISYRDNLGGFLAYLIFPAIAIALPKSAMGVKILRSSLIRQGKQDYVRTARSRGNTENRILFRHVFRNALIPAVTFWALTISDIVANSIIIEKVFTIPGLGTMLIQSIANRDYPVVQAILVMVAALVVLVNFLVDILYTRIDPRVM